MAVLRTVATLGIASWLLVAPWPLAAAPQPPRTTPARDALPGKDEKKGTAVIRGRVVGADGGHPLRRARITIRAPELATDGRRETSTDPDGRYEFTDLPAARYRVSVTRGGYLPLEYGQRRPGEQGRPLQVADGQTVEKIDFTLPRMSVIRGRVTDENAEPIEGVGVFAMRVMFFEGSRRLVPVATGTTTDEMGEYRILRLSPGTYSVMAVTHDTWKTGTNQGTVFAYLPTYYPGVTNPGEARRVALGIGQQVPAIDFSLVPGRTPTVSGRATDSKGRPFKTVDLREEIRGASFGSFRGGPSTNVSSDGTFSIPNVPPGEYRLTAARMPDDPGGEPEVAQIPLVVETTHIEDLVLIGSAGGTVSGRVVVEGDPPPKMSAMRVMVTEPLRAQPSPVLLGVFRTPGGYGASLVKDDGSFSVQHVFGRARFQVTVPDGWMLKAVVQNGREITDAPIELKSGEELSGVEVLISNRVTSVEGVLSDDKGAPIRDATVLVYASDDSKWFESARSVRAARPDQSGHWQVKGIPAGEYLVVALDYVEDGAWNDPEYLESLRRYAQRVGIAEGGTQTVALKLTTPAS